MRKYLKNRFFRIWQGLFLLFFIGMFSVANAQIGKIVHSFAGPSSHPAGLAFDGNNLWVSDLSADRIYQLNPNNGQVLHSIPSPGGAPSGLAWDGQTLWCSDNDLDKIFQLDPISGAVLRTVEIGTTTPRGLTFKDGLLFYQDSGTNTIYKIDLSNDQVVHSFAAPSGANRGLVWDGTYFWSVDRSLNEFYLIDPEYEKVVMILQAPGSFSYGLAWDGEYLWNADYENNIIYKIAVRGDELMVPVERREFTVRYKVFTENTGSSNMSLTTYLAVPPQTAFQELLSTVQFTPAPGAIMTDNYGQKVAYYSDIVAPGGTRNFEWQVNAATTSVHYCYLPERTGNESDIPAEIRSTYTRDGSKYLITDPVIQNAVAEAIGDETRFYWKVRLIHDYVISHIAYYRDGHWSTAPECLAAGEGSCSEYTFTFVAMCRAAGIPARYEAGGHVRATLPYEDTVFHRWAQVYFPGIGWVPVDCTWDDRKYPANQARYFGGYSTDVLVTTVGGGASNLMSWSYNLRQVSSGGKRSTTRKMEFLPLSTSVAEERTPLPEDFRLKCQNYPNPFNANTTIQLITQMPTHAEIKILNALGQEVAQVYAGFLVPGTHRFVWRAKDRQGSDVPSGMYFLQAKSGKVRILKKMILLR